MEYFKVVGEGFVREATKSNTLLNFCLLRVVPED
jgi:hypothetical protein